MRTVLPIALVKNRKEPLHVVKEGKGFSHGELSKVKISFDVARRIGLRIDPRRKSVHEENIKVLKEWLGKSDKDELKKLKDENKRKNFALGGKNTNRVFRGLTSAGKKSRGLRKTRGLKNTYKHR